MTGLVYLAIIALWVMFLIPWLGRHRDEQNGRKTADRYHRAMDTLARAGRTIRHPRDHDDELTELEADELEALEVANAPAFMIPDVGQAWRSLAATVRVRPRAGRGSTAAMRRRRVLMVLVGTVVAAGAAALAGVLPVIVPGVVAVLLSGYLLLMVRQASRADLGAQSPPTGSAQADRYREATRRAQAQARGLLAPRQQETDAPAAAWDAVPATLPTYVSKPKASKVPRVVDLTAPTRAWNGQAMVQRAQQERRRAEAAAAQEQFEREMAVLERDPVQEVAELANPDRATYQRQTYRRAANG